MRASVVVSMINKHYKHMKRAILFAVPLLAVLCASCAIEIDKTEQIAQDEQVLTVVARTGDSSDTKTLVQSDGTSIYWTAGDAINLFYGSGSAGQFTTSITEPSEVAEFTGTISVATGSTETGHEAKSFWAVYPYNAANTCDGTGVTLTIPGSQETVPGSFANKLNPTVATSPGLDLTFYNVGSWFIFSVTQEGVTSAEFRGNNNEDVAGTVRVSMDGSSRPAATVQNGVKSITITPAGGGTFTVGELYYIVVLPQTMENGYTLKLKKGSLEAECVVSTSAQFVRSQYRRKRNADSGLTYVSNNIDFEDSNVKSICVTNWDTDGDGELSYDEAAAVTSLSTYFRRNTSIQSFNELVYFEGLTSIDYAAFIGCTALEEIMLPSTISSIGGNAFGGCTSLKTVTHQGGGIRIDANAFNRCTNLENFSFDGISYLGSGSFANCTSLQAIIDIPASVEEIWYMPFLGCTQITRFTGPHTDSAGQMLFYIQHDDLNGDVKHLGQILPSIVNFTMPAGKYFLNCTLGEKSARTITIPAAAEIGFGSTITIPENVESLTFGDGFDFSSCTFAPMPIGCEIYSEYASADHSCLIINNTVRAFSYPRTNWDNQQCYRFPAGVKFGAKVKLNSTSDQSSYCWGLVFPSSVTFPDLGSNTFSLEGNEISFIFESGVTAMSALEYNYNFNSASGYYRVIIPYASYSGEPGGYYYLGSSIMVCPFKGSLPNTGQQMSWWLEGYYGLDYQG